MSERFTGELKSIDPKKIITEEYSDDVENFFLGLSVIFNDLKGIILFNKMLGDIYEQPQNDERSDHSGNYCGVCIYIMKLILSTINEFFIFIKKNENVFQKSEFKIILNKLTKIQIMHWGDIVKASLEKKIDPENFLKTIAKIRSNVSFHYNQGEVFRTSYISRFFGSTEDKRAKSAYYSIGENLEATRFYFADAVIEEYLSLAAGKKFKEDATNNEITKKLYQQTNEVLIIIINIVECLLKNYIPYRRNLPS